MSTDDAVASALFGNTRRNVLALLFGRPEQSFYLREIARTTGTGIGVLQRELKRLERAGLIRRKAEGRQVYFSANPESPVFGEIRGLMTKTAGLADVLRLALLGLQKTTQVRVAFIYGSVASGAQRSRSDVDLMIVGDVTLTELLPILRPVQDRIGREINPTIYTPEDLRQRRDRGQHFISRVLSGPKHFLIGTERDLGELAGERLAD